MNNKQIVDCAKEIIDLLQDYAGQRAGSREMLLDPVLYSYLKGRGISVTRQHYVNPSATHPKRIDFRTGGTNPIVFELVVRPPKGGGQLYGTQNKSELRKLCRIRQSQAKGRVLLLVDLSPYPIPQNSLKSTYDSQNSGKGKYRRHPVKVIYVHKDIDYKFRWSR